MVYTPNEIVRFMIEGADWLCEKHFGRNLIDQRRRDPRPGHRHRHLHLRTAGALPRPARRSCAHKYREELHANEVAILPYYVANLNIEATYAAITGELRGIPEPVLRGHAGQRAACTPLAHGTTADLFGSVSEENVARIKRQNSRKISVIIGNPPYNANQANENDNNKNREIPGHRRAHQADLHRARARRRRPSSTTCTPRFFRWASDRLRRRTACWPSSPTAASSTAAPSTAFARRWRSEFAEIRVVDLGGDVRANPKL
ncbi:MAG: hypothetical protein MZW92_38480 [Comamonadaceae bacterium]|nr:hypothetical protein [Comamonadaceae bacterium]